MMDSNSVDYDEDFYAWTVEQARLLRLGDLSAIDVANIAEEIESMGRSDRRALESRLTVLLTHLLKWRIQSRMRSSSWSGTIGEQRRRIAKLLRESPSLRPFVDESLTEAYGDAREAASNQTGLPETEFPTECPFTPDEVLSRSFLPES
jgi:ribosomal protein L29